VFQQNFGGILVLDEIGRMELLSDRFRQEVEKAFSNPSMAILATIPVRPLSFTESLRHSPNTTVLVVSSCDGITAVLMLSIHGNCCLTLLTRNKKAKLLIKSIDSNCFLLEYHSTKTVYVGQMQSLNVHVCTHAYADFFSNLCLSLKVVQFQSIILRNTFWGCKAVMQKKKFNFSHSELT
jgi:hypothetical protein